MNVLLNAAQVRGLTTKEAANLDALLKIFRDHESRNNKKMKYYEGKTYLGEFNLGIAIPEGLSGLEIGCDWAAKSVDVLAARSMFDGFVGADGTTSEIMARIEDENDLVTQYISAVTDQLIFGSTFATLSAVPGSCRIRFHSPLDAAAMWSGEKNRIDCGFAIIDTAPDETEANTYQPSVINYYTDDFVLVLRRDGSVWKTERIHNPMGRPLMEPLIWNATSKKPFGRSRIKKTVRRIVKNYLGVLADARVAIEFATSPQKYLMGLTDEQFDAMVNDKFKAYCGSILLGTTNPETGQNPEFGQLSQGTIEAHVQMVRLLATQFASATGLSVADVGIINDANPTSSDAILAQTQSLVGLAEKLNHRNGNSLRTIARMAIAIAKNTTLDRLTDDDNAVIAHFKNPAMPNIASTADAAVKIASTRPNFAQTDVYLEMIGFSPADIRRVRAQERQIADLAAFNEEFSSEVTDNEQSESEDME